MELRRYLRIARRWWALVLVTTLAGAAVGYLETSTTKLYRAGCELYVGPHQLAQDQSELYALSNLGQILASYARMVPTDSIAAQALRASGVARTASAVVAETAAVVPAGTSLIAVAVTDADPVVAQKLANAMADAFVARVETLQASGPGTVLVEPVTVFSRASLPAAPLTTGGGRHKMALGAAFGLALAVLAVALVERFDQSVRGPEDLERRLGVPLLATVPLRPPLEERPAVG